MKNSESETKARLLETAVNMLDTHQEKEVTAAEILRRTGIARGSLYHFWDSIGDLIADAYLVRYSRYVASSGAVISKVLDVAKSKDEAVAGLRRVTEHTQDPARKANRYERARIIAMAEGNERFRIALSKVQLELTDLFTAQFKLAQDKGWFNKDFDPRAGAVLIQAYTLGKIVDDIVDEPMDSEAWNSLISLILDRALISE
jgi:AcrR family transcriptional regulator